MSGIMEFLLQILIYNTLKPLRCGKAYFAQHFSLPHQESDLPNRGQASSYSQIIQCASLRFGRLGKLCANVASMFIGMVLMVAADMLRSTVNVRWVKTVLHVFCFIFCICKFDALRFQDKRSYLELAFAAYSLRFQSNWSITYLFLAAFENIAYL
ncbi:MAG: hypothetical protein VB144_09170 [Clostridia bacterium]|nr:hypothetical protein [Clostridia bacterium]